MSDISHFRTSVSHPRSDVSCSAARPDKTRQIDFETKQAVAVMFSEGDRIRVEVPHCLKAVGMIQKQMKQNLDAKLSRTRAGEIQRGYCSYSGICRRWHGSAHVFDCSSSLAEICQFMMCVFPRVLVDGAGGLCSVHLKH